MSDTVTAIMAIKGHVSEGGKMRSLWGEEKDYSNYLTDQSSMIYFQFRAVRCQAEEHIWELKDF